MNYTIALVGNPNSGKTSLFNALTGLRQKVGNWTGVTVESKVGFYKKDKSISIVDLPGVYSLSGDGVDEYATINYIKNNKPNVIINIVDGTNLERNLFLTTQLTRLNIPFVIAVNFCDQLKKNNIKLNVNNLSKMFGVPVILVSALKRINIEHLVDTAIKSSSVSNFNVSLRNDKETYLYIENNIDELIQRKKTKAEIFTYKADCLLMHRLWGIPIFFLIMTFIYFVSIKIGGVLGSVINTFVQKNNDTLRFFLSNNKIYDWIISLVCDAVVKSLGGVLSFLPQVVLLLMLMAIVEQTGYASRVAFIFDRLLRSFGLSGKSILPMIVSCGCTTTGIMATRTIDTLDERRMTIFLSPFLPCSAKTAVFAYFASAFFNGSALIATSMYFLGIICVCLFGTILKKMNVFRSKDSSFVLEIPSLRIPSVKDIFAVGLEKVKEFISKAGLIVFCVSVFLWLFKNVGITGYVGDNVEKSFLYWFGEIIKYIFYPLGFCNWQTSVAIISGSFAKEAVVESLNILANDKGALFNNSYSVYAFMAFILLSPPCVASIATAKRELNSLKWLVFMMLFQFLSAYIVALLINLFGIAVEAFDGLLLSLIIVIILMISLILSIVILKKRSCRLCGKCKKGETLCRKKVKRFTI